MSKGKSTNVPQCLTPINSAYRFTFRLDLDLILCALAFSKKLAFRWNLGFIWNLGVYSLGFI